jgi:hypothetical protein
LVIQCTLASLEKAEDDDHLNRPINHPLKLRFTCFDTFVSQVYRTFMLRAWMQRVMKTAKSVVTMDCLINNHIA